jgi:hypothetical protein
LAAKAAGEGYVPADPRHDPFHGYYFKVLTGQATDTPTAAAAITTFNPDSSWTAASP